MAKAPEPSKKPTFSAEVIKERCRTMAAWLEQAANFARALDWLGDAKKYPAGSEQQALARVRDEVDFALAQFFRRASTEQRLRAETTHCIDLLVDAAGNREGDGHDALHLMRRLHELSPEKLDENCDPGPETFPDSFAWDTYLRVSALTKLADEFPQHLRHSARQMHGWPMIVSHHLDGRSEFERVAKLLELGAEYPLNVAPRKKRGTESPLLRYLEPLVWRLHVLQEILIESAETRQGEDFARRIYGFWWEFPDPKPQPDILAILQLVPSLPPLTQETARDWSRKIIVPIIMLEDAGTGESCKEPALRNIWQHRSVKSRATFQSRLHSAVTDTLQRFGRPG